MDLRPTLTAYLHQRLDSIQDAFRHNLALLGPTGSGKTALIHHVLQTSPARLIKIHCRLRRESIHDFVRGWITATLRAVVDVPEVAPEELLPHVAATLPKTAEAIHQLLRARANTSHTDLLVRAFDLIPTMHQECRRPCVLVLDEFLSLDDLGVPHAFHELGKRVMTWPFALFVVTSSSPARARYILREKLHLLFGQFELMTMGAIDAEAGFAWMDHELPSAQDALAVKRFLLHWIGTHPWYLSVMVTRIKELAQLQHDRRISEGTLFRAAWDVLGSPDGALHQWCAAHIDRLTHQRHGLLAVNALAAIAAGARTNHAIAARCGHARHLSQVLQDLTDQDLILRKGACWVMLDQLFASWLLVTHELRTQRLDRAASMEIFQRTLKSIWTEWLGASQQPLADRVGRLLSSFRNETVCLDHKTGRLPSFDALNAQRPTQRQETYIVAESKERRWCCMVHDGALDENAIAAFEQFCRRQTPKPSRKIVIARDGLELNAKLLAKTSDMWVWEPDDLNLLFLLYGQSPLSQ